MLRKGKAFLKQQLISYLGNSLSQDFQNSGTAFFRNKKLLETLQLVLAQSHQGKKIRLWNIGASIGAESYSFACYLQELVDKKIITDYEVIASDNVFSNLKYINQNAYPVELLSEDFEKNTSFRKYFSIKNKKISFSEEIAKRVSGKIYNFNDPSPLFGGEYEISQTFDVIVFNYALSYSMPKSLHIEALVSKLIDHMADGGALIGNFFHLPWLEASKFDVYHESSLKVLKEAGLKPLSINSWEIFSEDIEKTAFPETFARYFLDRWDLSAEDFSYPSSIFIKNPKIDYAKKSGVFDQVAQTGGDKERLVELYYESLLQNKFFYPLLYSLLTEESISSEKKNALITRTVEQMNDVFYRDLKQKLAQNLIKLKELHLEKNKLWKLRDGINFTLESLEERFTQFPGLTESAREFIYSSFIRINFYSGNYYSSLDLIKKIEHKQNIVQKVSPIIIQIFERLGMFNSLKAFLETYSLEGPFFKYNRDCVGYYLGERNFKNARELKNSYATFIKDGVDPLELVSPHFFTGY